MKNTNYKAAILAVLMSVSLTACDSDPQPSNTPTPPGEEKCSPASDSCPKPE